MSQAIIESVPAFATVAGSVHAGPGSSVQGGWRQRVDRQRLWPSDTLFSSRRPVSHRINSAVYKTKPAEAGCRIPPLETLTMVGNP